MLIGQFSSKLTDKDRVSVPKKVRDEFGREMVLAKWYEGCLVIVSDKIWNELLLKLKGPAKLITEPVRDIDRFILGSAFEIKLDGQGRFILPKPLLEYAGIKNEIVFVCLNNRVELWAMEKWQDLESQIQLKATKAVENIAKSISNFAVEKKR